jgi:hypothetical protein
MYGKTHSNEIKTLLSDLAKDKVGNKNPRYGKDNFSVKDTQGNIFWVTKDDPRFISGELVGVNKGCEIHSEESKLKLSKANSGQNNPMFGVHLVGEQNHMYGKTHNKETRNKISEALLNKPLIKCPHCGLESRGYSNLKRYHFDSCKSKI